MLFNVATLLREPTGSTRHVPVPLEIAEVPENDYRREVAGDARLLRTSRGVLVRANLQVHPQLECARCLSTFDGEVDLVVEEVFVQLRDPLTHEPVLDAEPDDFRIIDEQYLDLSEAVRQYEQAALPISPLCAPDCQGLCSQCGLDLNLGACGCPPEPATGPWSALAGLADQLQTTEGSHGGSEA